MTSIAETQPTDQTDEMIWATFKAAGEQALAAVIAAAKGLGYQVWGTRNFGGDLPADLPATFLPADPEREVEPKGVLYLSEDHTSAARAGAAFRALRDRERRFDAGAFLAGLQGAAA